MTWNQFIAFQAHRHMREAMTQLGQPSTLGFARQRIVSAAGYMMRVSDNGRYAYVDAPTNRPPAEVVSIIRWARAHGKGHRMPSDEQLPALASMNRASIRAKQQIAQPMQDAA